MVKVVNKFLLYEREKTVQIVFYRLELAALHIFGFSDASFEKNVDHYTHLRFIILLRNASVEPVPSI